MANPGKSIMVSPIPFMAHPIDHLNVLGKNQGKFLNRLSFWITNYIKSIVLNRVAKKFRKDFKGINISAYSIRKAMMEKEKTFYTISPSLFSRPDYWPEPANVVGYYERDKTINWQPGEELIKFLERHEKIVFISFGSMSNSNPAEKTRIIVEVLKKHNIAAIINTSWGGLKEITERGENILFVSNIPYDWIFPKMYAIIHHGGSGTTHTALKYACPSLVVPHILDQFYWSKTISHLGVGPQGISIKNLDEKIFEHRLLDLMNNPSYKKNAIMISQKMNTESDIDKLYDMIIC
jgi:sterol 3beta-glucosyltransferase